MRRNSKNISLSKTAKVKGKSETARSINSYLDILQNMLYDSHAELLQTNLPIPAELLCNKSDGEDERSRNLLEIFLYYHKNMKKLIGKDFVAKTVSKFKSSYDRILEFFNWKYKVSDISLALLKYEFITDFEFY